MHIGIDATALYGRYGGVEYSLWNLLDALKSQAPGEHLEYSVYIPQDGPAPELLQSFPPNWRWVRLPFRGDQKLKRILWQQLVLPRRARADGCDLLHAPTYVIPICNRNLRPRVPGVLTVYDLIALDQPHFATRLNRLHYRALLPRSITAAERVIVPSQSVRDAIVRRLPQAASKIRVIPLGLEPIFVHEVSAELLDDTRTRYNLPPEFLLFVGNFEPKKNLENLLLALEMIPDAPPLVVAGGVRPWGNKPGVEKGFLPKSGIAQSIGYVERRDLPALYSLCRAFVFPSLAEGFGLPVLEALACGAPVVTSPAVALSQLEKVALLCEPEKPESIATQIRRVLGDEGLRVQLSRAGREYSRAFTWQRTASAVLDVYRELV